MDSESFPQRTYLRRRGRMTRGQHRALDELADHQVHTVGSPTPSWTEVFGGDAPLGVEIGFGMGQALLSWAQQQPDWNLLGIEVYQPGIGALLLGAQRDGATNLRVLEGDAELAFEANIAPASLDEVRIFFPDPWPKKRHNKRRLVQPQFIKLLVSRLKSGGRLLLATDWEPYAHWMLEVLNGERQLENLSSADFAQRATERVITRFEARGTRLGHDVWDLAFRRL
jgi:tRNA (guanine-N7-)-methyltransferase